MQERNEDERLIITTPRITLFFCLKLKLVIFLVFLLSLMKTFCFQLYKTEV